MGIVSDSLVTCKALWLRILLSFAGLKPSSSLIGSKMKPPILEFLIFLFCSGGPWIISRAEDFPEVSLGVSDLTFSTELLLLFWPPPEEG